MIANSDFEAAIHHALRQLYEGLPAKYVYHSYQHTAEDVLPAATRLAEHAGLAEQEKQLLRVAAAYHDLGFLVRVKGHENESARFAGEQLPHFGFLPPEITRIQQTIMATQLPQTPLDLAGQLLADADLDLLGREDFPFLSRRLQEETIILGTPISDLDWHRKQLQFVTGHTYFSRAAHDLRDGQKARNIAYLRSEVERLTKE